MGMKPLVVRTRLGPGRAPWRSYGGVVVGLLAALAIGGAMVGAGSRLSDLHQLRPPDGLQAPLPAIELAGTPLEHHIQAEIAVATPIGGGWGPFVAAGRYLWLAPFIYAPEDMSRIDPSTNRVEAVPNSGGSFMTGTREELWASWGSTTRLLDPETGATLERLPVAGNVVVGDGGVWIATTDRELYRRSTAGRVTYLGTLPHRGIPQMVYAADSLWADWSVAGFPPVLMRIDPRSGHVLAELGGVGGMLATDGDDLWVEDRSRNGVSRVDIGTNRVVATIETGFIRSMTLTSTHVWVLGSRLYGIDRRSNAVQVYEMPDGDPHAPVVVLSLDASIWLVALAPRHGTEVWRLDLQ